MANILIVSGNLKNWNKNSGGVERTATLAEALPNHNVTFLCFSWDTSSEIQKINENITFIRVGVDDRALRKHRNLIRQDAKKNYDITSHILKPFLTTFRNKVKELAQKSDVLILDHYSVSPLVEDVYGTIPIIYNSHNAEITMGKQLYPKDEYILDIVDKMERSAIERSTAMTYCSTKDIVELQELYNVPEKTMYVPNGTVMQLQTDPAARIKSNNIIFVGSGHPPNGVAAKRIVEIAKMVPDYNFVICGKASGYLADARLPKNVQVLGQVSDEKLHELFKESFAFINPMESGSGTHLKVMKALSYGIPIISSVVGARGFTEKEISETMVLMDTDSDAVRAIEGLSNLGVYKSLSNNGYALSNRYDWETIKAEYASFVESVMTDINPSTGKPNKRIKEKILVYSIIRNTEDKFNQYYSQLKSIVEQSPEYDFYLSIYENDSDDNTKKKMFTSDWSFFSGVSLISENLNTPFFGPVKDATRVENLSHARNKAIEAGGFLNNMDYVLMVEGDVTYDIKAVRKLLKFKDKEPDFDIVSSVSIRENGSHYDWWATRTTAEYVTTHSELERDYKKKSHGKYYSTSNGICLYRAKAFHEGARHHWMNSVTNEFDCEMVVLCQKFHELGHGNVYILYDSLAFHNK